MDNKQSTKRETAGRIEDDILVAFADALYAAGAGAGGKAIELDGIQFLIDHFKEGFRQALQEFPGRWADHRITVLQVAATLGAEAAKAAEQRPSIERTHLQAAAEAVRNDPRCPKTKQLGRYCP